MTPESPELAHARELARSQENLVGAVLAGAAVALVCAAVWAGITVVTHYQLGIVAIGVGHVVGLTVRSVGRGTTAVFAAAAAGLAFLGCAVGNLLTGCALLAEYQQTGLLDVLKSLDLATAQRLMVATAQPMDLVFYALAVWQAFRVSRAPVPVPKAPPATAA